ncbi:MAG: bifunctional diguanylate cyclase/phosphodiesterase [Litorilituus sp.]|jgi:diguanylate cyclase (GGDEF)-like protein|nr:bifunctional diguanylate cyclase/phosphodiesterase [Litorilituus sp.]
MLENINSIAFVFASQAIVFAILSFIFFIYYQVYRRKYVQYWLFSFIALTGYYLSNAFLHGNNSYLFATNYLQLFYAQVQQSSLYLFLVFFLFGVYTAKKQKKPHRRIYKLAISTAIMLGVTAASFYAFDENNTFNRFYFNVSLPSFIFACTYLSISFYLYVDKKPHFSSQLLMLFCLLLGFRYLLYSFISIVALIEHWFSYMQVALLYFDVAAYNTLGFFLLIWIQGAERNAAVHAISKAQYLGKHDSLTGALNRKQVMEKLSEVLVLASERKSLLAIFLIDIKQFKFINDTYGLKTGDFILGEFAKRLNNSILLPKAVGRLSGDSFMFVLESNRISSIERAPEHLHQLVNRSFKFNKQEVHIQASIGYCVYPKDGSEAEELLQNANLALHHAESNNIPTTLFEPSAQLYGRRMLIVEKELKSALINDEFVLYHQPQLNLFTNRLEGVEALVRWQHPEKGLLLPSSFLDDIDALNMNSEFDNYILDKACQANARWFKKYKRRVAIAINITAIEFQDPKLVTNIQSLMLKYQIQPKYLELEITENVVMTDISKAMNTIVSLQNMGIKVSIDDFGTGYSSLAYLRKLPIDKIKIDRSFISEVAANDSDMTIVKSMIELSHGLGKRVLAEGVETAEQLTILRNLGCDAVQGYYISKPIAEEDLAKYLVKRVN